MSKGLRNGTASETGPTLSRCLVGGGRSVSGSCSLNRSDSFSCSGTAPRGKVPCRKGGWAGQGCSRPSQCSSYLLPHPYYPSPPSPRSLYPPSLTGVDVASWRLLQSTRSSTLGKARICFWRRSWGMRKGVGNKGCELGGSDALGWLSRPHCPPPLQTNGSFHTVLPSFPSPCPASLGLEVGEPGMEDGAEALTTSCCSSSIFWFCLFTPSKKEPLFSSCICQARQMHGQRCKCRSRPCFSRCSNPRTWC